MNFAVLPGQPDLGYKKTPSREIELRPGKEAIHNDDCGVVGFRPETEPALNLHMACLTKYLDDWGAQHDRELGQLVDQQKRLEVILLELNRRTINSEATAPFQRCETSPGDGSSANDRILVATPSGVPPVLSQPQTRVPRITLAAFQKIDAKVSQAPSFSCQRTDLLEDKENPGFREKALSRIDSHIFADGAILQDKRAGDHNREFRRGLTFGSAMHHLRESATDWVPRYSQIDEFRTLSHKEKVKMFVQSGVFDGFSCFLVLANAILVGVGTQYEATAGVSHGVFRVTQLFLNVWYILELVLRFVADGSAFFLSPLVRFWNMFDVLLVAIAVIDIIVDRLEIRSPFIQRVVEAIIICRLVRICRVFRVLGRALAFRKMVYALQASLETLFWAMVLLFTLMYGFAIWFTVNATRHLNVHGNTMNIDDSIKLRDKWGSVLRSTYSLFLSITGGISWNEVLVPILHVGGGLAPLLIMYIIVSMFGVLNVITSVFVDSAMESTRHHRELIMHEQHDKKDTILSHLREIFSVIDIDGDGHISWQELDRFMSVQATELRGYFEALDLNAHDTKAFFKLLDYDNSGYIDLDEFLACCTLLCGEARSFDLHCLMYENRRCLLNWDQMLHFMSARFQTLLEVENRILTVVESKGTKTSKNRVSADEPQYEVCDYVEESVL